MNRNQISRRDAMKSALLPVVAIGAAAQPKAHQAPAVPVPQRIDHPGLAAHQYVVACSSTERDAALADEHFQGWSWSLSGDTHVGLSPVYSDIRLAEYRRAIRA